MRPLPPDEIRHLARFVPDHAVRDYQQRFETKALHPGSYETAIESMLRRMRDQREGGLQFYLYRVALRGSGVAVEPGWRDENQSPAADVTDSEMSETDVIRYLNV
jgi:hypothetical protein